MSRTFSMTVATAVAASLFGCAANEQLAGISASNCFTDEQCQPGFTCQNLVCVDPNVDLNGIMIAVDPPAESAYASTHFLTMDIVAAGPAVALTLPAPARFDYRVLDANGDRIDAHLTFAGTRRIPGREAVISETFLSARPASLSLVPDRYQVRFLPVGTDVPGVDVPFEVRATTTQKDFTLSATLRNVRGNVAHRADSNIRLPGVLVRAFSVPSGLPSSSSVTDADGAFNILLPDTDDTSFRIIAEIGADLQPAWRYEQIIRVERGEDRTLDIGLDRSADDRRGLARIRILGVRDEGPGPIAGARVTLTASTALATQRFEVAGTTDREGYVVVSTPRGSEPLVVLAAQYGIAVEPPVNSAFGRSKGTIDLSRAGPDLIPDKQIELMRRPRVAGRIVSSAGQAVDHAILDFESLDTPTASLPSTTTDASGAYSIWLDPGRYLVRVDPGGAALAGEILPVGFTEITVGDDGGDIVLPPARLPSGSVLNGVLYGAGGDVVPRANVEVFATEAGAARSIGRTVSDTNGLFSLVVRGR